MNTHDRAIQVLTAARIERAMGTLTHEGVRKHISDRAHEQAVKDIAALAEAGLLRQ